MTDLKIFKNGKDIWTIKECGYFPKVGEHILCGTEIYKIESLGLDVDANIVYACVVIGDDIYRYLFIPKKVDSNEKWRHRVGVINER